MLQGSRKAVSRCSPGALGRSAGGVLAASLVALWVLGSGCGDDDSGNGNQNNVNPQGVCGDGVVDPGEQCDSGADNSDVAPDACRTTCRLPYCGDGVVDPSNGEACDSGPQNNDLVPNACRSDCSPARCGDGVVDDGEECDEGADNADVGGAACRTTCALPVCGDGLIDPGQVCYDFAGAPAPGGLFTPADIDGDGLDDLVGWDARSERIVRISRNLGGAFAPARAYLRNKGGGDLVPPVLRLQDGTEALVTGAYPTLLAPIDPEGRLEIPAAVTIPRPNHQGNPMLTTPFTLGQTRYASLLIPQDSLHCRVALDATGFVEQSMECTSMPQSLGDLDLGVSTGTALPCSQGGSVAVAYAGKDSSGFNMAALVLRLDGQGRLAEMEVQPFPVGVTGSFIVKATVAGDVYWVGTYRDSAIGISRFMGVPWDASTCRFDDAAMVPISPNLYGTPIGDPFQFSSLAAVELDGNNTGSPWLDLVFANGWSTCVLTNPDPAGPDDVWCCNLGSTVTDVTAGDLDASTPGAETVLALLSTDQGEGQLVAYDTSAAQCPSGSPTVLGGFPALPGRVHTGDFDGDGSLDVAILPQLAPWEQTTPFGALIWRSAVASQSSPDVLTVPISFDTWVVTPFPHQDGSPGIDLLALVGGGASPCMALVQSQGGQIRAGWRLWTLNGSDPEYFDDPTGYHFAEDLSGDGLDDLVMTSGPNLVFYEGPFDPDAGFVGVSIVPMPYQPGYAILEDVVGDGHKDFVMIRMNPFYQEGVSDNKVVVMPGLGVGFSAEPVVIDTLYQPVLLAAGDLDGDGDTDLVTVHQTLGVLAVLWNDSGGFSFDPDLDVYMIPGAPTSATVLDLDQDGFLDLVVSAPEQGMGPLWLRGLPDPAAPTQPLGQFAPAEDLSLTSNEIAVLPAEVTGAPPLDLLVLRVVGDQWATTVLQANP